MSGKKTLICGQKTCDMAISEQIALAAIFYVGQVFVFSRSIKKNVLEWFLLIVCKEHTLSRSANFLSRNHPTLFVNSVFLLAACVNSLVDSFPEKHISSLWSLIWTTYGKVIFNHLIGNNCQGFRNGLLDSYFCKLTLGSDCWELCFWVVAFKTILTQ